MLTTLENLCPRHSPGELTRGSSGPNQERLWNCALCLLFRQQVEVGQEGPQWALLDRGLGVPPLCHPQFTVRRLS